jgi:raffinose/stachyose/melibiose transport system substrate-binding protein
MAERAGGRSMKIPSRGAQVWKSWIGPILILLVYLASATYVARVNFSEGGDAAAPDGRKVIRVAHDLTDRRVQEAFQNVADAYERLHPDVRIRVQAIPQRAYEQWATTQLMGGTAPDLIQMLDRSGQWETLGQQYLVPLTAHIGQPNPYNEGTVLEGVPWRDTYVDGMEGGYFFHVMEFFSIPTTLDNIRIFYNKDLFRKIVGSDQPPRNFRSWLEIAEKIRNSAVSGKKTIYPLAVAQEDDLYSLFFPTLTGNTMDRYDLQMWGISEYAYIYYALLVDAFDLKQERIHAAFRLIKDVYRLCQPSFLSDLAEQKRFLFIQERAAMVTGNTRDLGIYREFAEFEVGVFDFPQTGPDDPIYGKYYVGPAVENPLSTFSFGVTQVSRHQDIALDFMRFATSLKNNELFCGELAWYPAITGTELRDPNLQVFEPRTEGVISYPILDPGHGPINLYFEQNFPLYLDGQIDFNRFMDELGSVFLERAKENFQLKLDRSLGNRPQTEYNLSSARAKMLFGEAGTLQAGRVMGSRTSYQLALEIEEMHDGFINFNQFVFQALKEGTCKYPLFPDQSE